jgi:hypothetical protein
MCKVNMRDNESENLHHCWKQIQIREDSHSRRGDGIQYLSVHERMEITQNLWKHMHNSIKLWRITFISTLMSTMSYRNVMPPTLTQVTRTCLKLPAKISVPHHKVYTSFKLVLSLDTILQDKRECCFLLNPSIICTKVYHKNIKLMHHMYVME